MSSSAVLRLKNPAYNTTPKTKRKRTVVNGDRGSVLAIRGLHSHSFTPSPPFFVVISLLKDATYDEGFCVLDTLDPGLFWLYLLCGGVCPVVGDPSRP